MNWNETQIYFKPYIFKRRDKWTNNKQIPNNSNCWKVSSQCSLISYISMLGNFDVFLILRSWKLAFFINTIPTLFHISQERLDSLGHFRVPKPLTFKMRLGVQPFLWKWVLFAREWKIISISKAEHLPSFWNRGPGELGNCLIGDIFFYVSAFVRIRAFTFWFLPSPYLIAVFNICCIPIVTALPSKDFG